MRREYFLDPSGRFGLLSQNEYGNVMAVMVDSDGLHRLGISGSWSYMLKSLKGLGKFKRFPKRKCIEALQNMGYRII